MYEKLLLGGPTHAKEKNYSSEKFIDPGAAEAVRIAEKSAEAAIRSAERSAAESFGAGNAYCSDDIPRFLMWFLAPRDLCHAESNIGLVVNVVSSVDSFKLVGGIFWDLI